MENIEDLEDLYTTVKNTASKITSLQTLPKGLYQLAVFMQDGKVSSQTFVKE